MSINIERQIEKSWLQHEPDRAKIPAWAWRELRQFKRSIADSAAAIEAALCNKSVLNTVADSVNKRGVGRVRAVKQLKKILAGATITSDRDSLQVNWLVPCGPMIAEPRDPGEAQEHRTVPLPAF